MSMLTRTAILARLRPSKSEPAASLTITPLTLSQIGPASVDLHLGNEFLVFRRVSLTHVDIHQDHILGKNVHQYQEKVRIGESERFVIHPNQLVLGATREYVSLPSNLAAIIGGRSTWGRTGLIIATATQIAPGFKGCITLELVNEGEVPLVLRPGYCIAQLTLLTTDGQTKSYPGRYQHQTGPEFPKFDKETNSTQSR